MQQVVDLQAQLVQVNDLRQQIAGIETKLAGNKK